MPKESEVEGKLEEKFPELLRIKIGEKDIEGFS
jgi:hypothetical protein